MIVEKYNISNKKEWNEFVSRSKNGTFLHNRDFMDYHSDRFIDHSLMFYNEGKLVALLPANIVGRTIYSHQGLSYAGLITDSNMKAVLMLDLFITMKDYFIKNDIDKLEYKAVPFIYHQQPSDEDLYGLFRNNARLIRRDISTVINLDKPLKMSSGRKDNIRRANRAGVSIFESDDLASFHKILSTVLAKYDVLPTHSLNEIKLLSERFPKNIKLFSAFEHSEMIAGIVIFEMESVIHTQYMASSKKGQQLGALDLIVKNIIDCYKHSHKVLSFGPSTENSGWYLNEGLIKQKEGFGGRAILNDFYTMEVNND